MNELYCQDCEHFSYGTQRVYNERRFAYWCNAKCNVIFYRLRKAYPMWGKNKEEICIHYKRRNRKWWELWKNGLVLGG